MKTWMISVGILMLALVGCGSSSPKTLFAATLNGANERPTAVVTSAVGAATLTLNESAKSITVTGTYSGMTVAAPGAHIHGNAGKEATAGVLFSLTAAGGQISGTFTVTDAQIADLRAGQWYVNLHSVANQGGEIRGQLE